MALRKGTSMDPKVIGAKVKSIRELLGQNQEEFSVLLGISRVQVSYIENGSRVINLEKLEMLCDLVGIELIEFLSDEDVSHFANLSAAFRSDSLSIDDMRVISEFRRIVSNYKKIKELSYAIDDKAEGF